MHSSFCVFANAHLVHSGIHFSVRARVQVISCRAAVAWQAKQPLVIETIQVEPPRVGEVRVQVSSHEKGK